MGINFRIKYIGILILLLFLLGATYEEVISDKKKQAEILEKRIYESKNRLSAITSGSVNIDLKIDSIESAVNSINNFLKNFENETYMTPEQIAIETNMIIYLAEDIERIQQSFRQKVVNMYKHGENYELELLLSSKTPNEYLRRNQYLQKFSQNRKKQLRDLKSKKFILEEKKKMLTLSTSSQRFYVESKRNDRIQLESRLKELKIARSNSENESKLISEKISGTESQLNNVKNFINNLENNKETFSGAKTNRINYESADLNSVKGNINLPVDLWQLSVPFGNIEDNSTGNISFNNGIDLSIAFGSKVYSVAAGTVTLTGEAPFYGKVIIITHPGGFRSVYASLSEINIKPGDVIRLNQLIGKTGETPEGQFFHFELWQNSSPVNPSEWLRF